MGYSSDNSRTIVLCGILLALTTSLIAVIIGSVSLAKSSHSIAQINALTEPWYRANQEKVWTIAIGDFGVNLEYLDEVSYQIKGYNVDVVEAVCKLANKTCVLMRDVNQRCWDSEPGQQARGGEGLMSGWYDACTGWVKTYPRSLTFDFTRAFVKRKDVAIYALNTSTVDYRDLTGLNVGFIDGWASDEHCLARYVSNGITGASLPSDRIHHLSSGMELIQALRSGQIDVAFAIKLPQLEAGFRRLTPTDFANNCYLDGAGMMTRKENTQFVTWWNDAFGRLVGTPTYDDICTRLKTVHGHKPGSGAKDVCIGY
ncbi:uncharacterized protein LOC100892647 [Strongylocentrotus purpuratus]|uniref:Solute-binding protein family 3/N-terminal domain-containing protein n=1 Tax=Strongylocentrotus purpuratus TaxID=7668 RepID=A0A7M7LL17_STRPU|nr:uncharacterized protein LOC100892647 [Strongylocentrotus purpuratus]